LEQAGGVPIIGDERSTTIDTAEDRELFPKA